MIMRDGSEERRKGYPIRKIYDQLGGATLAFAWVLLGLGTALGFAGKLTAEWIGLAGIIQALVTWRAVREDRISKSEVANGRP
jgi:hypothetical protein